MWLLVYIPAVMGILRYRRLSYWRWVGAIFIWQTAATFLFAAFGSLEEPERDGLIIRAVRQATDDGPMVALVGVAFLIVFWGGIAYFVRQLYADAKTPALGLATVKPVTKARKGLELLGLTCVIGWLLYSNINAMNAPSPRDGAADLTVEAVVDREVAAVKAAAPIRVDAITTMTDARREERTLILDYRLSPPDPISREHLEQTVRTSLLAQACAEDRLQDLLRTGASARYRYSLRDEEPVVLDLTAEICGSVPAGSAAVAPQNNASNGDAGVAGR